jgi:hypothetical protein
MSDREKYNFGAQICQLAEQQSKRTETVINYKEKNLANKN